MKLQELYDEITFDGRKPKNDNITLVVTNNNEIHVVSKSASQRFKNLYKVVVSGDIDYINRYMLIRILEQCDVDYFLDKWDYDIKSYNLVIKSSVFSYILKLFDNKLVIAYYKRNIDLENYLHAHSLVSQVFINDDSCTIHFKLANKIELFNVMLDLISEVDNFIQEVYK